MKPKIHASQRIRVINQDGWMHNETGRVLQVTKGTAQIQFDGGETGGFPVEMLVHDDPKLRPAKGQLTFF